MMRELEVTFLAHPSEMEVALEADKPSRLFTSGHDVVNRHVVRHEGVAHRDWITVVDTWIRQMTATHGRHSIPLPHGPGDSRDGRHDHDHHHGGHRSGPGMGTATAAGAVGLVAADVVDEAGGFVEDDDEDEGGRPS
jgi:sporulation-control protein